MLDFDRRFALGVFAARDAVDAEVADDDRRAGDLLDRAEQRVERAVAAGRRLADWFVAALRA